MSDGLRTKPFGPESELAALRVELQAARESQRPVPTDEGGPGREETYWMRVKLQAAIQHLRDIEDYYRLKGGVAEGFNMVRADRARDLYEAITEDFVNGKTSRPTRAGQAAALQDAREALRAAEGVLYALPKSAQSKRRSAVLAQVRKARAVLVEGDGGKDLGDEQGSSGDSNPTQE